MSVDRLICRACDSYLERAEKAEARLAKLKHFHHALLNTLGASKHYWIAKVYKNAKAAYETFLKENP